MRATYVIVQDGGMNTDHATPSTIPQTLVGISFDDAFRAQEFLVAVGRLAATGRLKLNDAVTVIKDEVGKTVVHETVDPTPGGAMLSGAMWAGLFGIILGGPVGWVAGLAIGAGAGAVSAKVIDLGVPDEWVQWFKSAARPQTATVALLVEDLDVAALIAESQRFTGAELVYANLDTATMTRLRDALAHEPSHDTPAGRDEGL